MNKTTLGFQYSKTYLQKKVINWIKLMNRFLKFEFFKTLDELKVLDVINI